jgi:manganese transport protein
MAEVNVLTAFMGRPEDPRTKFYRISLFILALPALAVVATGLAPYKILIFSQVALSIQLPLTLFPLVLLVADRRVMGVFASGRVERVLAVVASVFVTVLNVVLLYTLAGGPL